MASPSVGCTNFTIDTVRDWDPEAGPVVEQIKLERVEGSSGRGGRGGGGQLQPNRVPKPKRRNRLPDAVRVMDTVEVAKLVHAAIEMHDLNVGEFSVLVLGKQEEHVTELLDNPQPYNKLDKSLQNDYWTMARWLHKTIPERLQPFNFILKAKGLPEKSAGTEHSTEGTNRSSGMPPAELVRQFQCELRKYDVRLHDFVAAWTGSDGAKLQSELRDFVEFMRKPPHSYDKFSVEETQKSLAIQTWLCKPEKRKLEGIVRPLIYKVHRL